MIHYWIELALWMAGLFLIGCPLGALAHRLLAGLWRPRPGRGPTISGGS